MGNTKGRNSSIELLRILAMLMIISLHFWGFCINPSNEDMFTFGNLFGWLCRGISYISVNLYVLISAYFLCKSNFKFKKLLSLIIEVLFYSVVIYLLSVFCGNTTFSWFNCIKAFLPIISSEYWFATIYVGLYILFPFLNLSIKALNKKSFNYLIIVLSLLFVVIPNFFFFSVWQNFGAGYGIVWFVVLYYIGAYIRLYISQEYIQKHTQVIRLGAIVCLLSPFAAKILIALIEKCIWGSVIGSSAFYSNNSILIVPASVLTFMVFTTINIKSVRTTNIINFVSKSTFAVYLIHNNKYVKDNLWNYVRPHLNLNSIYIVIQYIVVILIIFISCILIDLIRRYIFYCVNKTSLPDYIHNNLVELLHLSKYEESIR